MATGLKEGELTFHTSTASKRCSRASFMSLFGRLSECDLCRCPSACATKASRGHRLRPATTAAPVPSALMGIAANMRRDGDNSDVPTTRSRSPQRSSVNDNSNRFLRYRLLLATSVGLVLECRAAHIWGAVHL